MSAFRAFCSKWPAFRRFFVLLSTPLALLWSLVAWIPLLSCPRKVSIIFLVDKVCLNFFGLFGEYNVCACVRARVRIHCSNYSLVSTFTNETKVSSPITRTMSLRNTFPSLWSYYKSQVDGILCTSVSVFETCVAVNMKAQPDCDNLVGNNAWNVWKFMRMFWNC
jgi:hypothetical protein